MIPVRALELLVSGGTITAKMPGAITPKGDRFAGHQNLETTRQYVHLSGHDLADRFAKTMHQIHAWRIDALVSVADTE